MATQASREKAAQVWCRPECSSIVMDCTLAEAFAEVLDETNGPPAEANQLADGRISLDLSTFALGKPWPLERVFFQVLHQLKVDPTYYLLLLAAAVNAGADIGEKIKFSDCVDTMKALADCAGIDLSEMEVIVDAPQGDKPS